ncbi:MAG TPA: hypothetical protein VK044_11315 [Virgibacillus sp.]|nr:hypothetical protein [Virgibacillus sp.]
MEWNDDYSAEQQKTKLLTGMGCLFVFLIIGLLVIILLAWYPTKIVYQILFPEETQLIVSHANEFHNTDLVPHRYNIYFR